MLKTRKMFIPSLVCVLTLSACSNAKFRETKDMADFKPEAVIMEGALENTGDLGTLVYEGSADVTRYTCHHQGKVKMTIINGSFEMTVTTPTVSNNCQPGGDWETAKISGEVKMNGGEMYFQKCNKDPFPPTGLGNYTLIAASGGVSCFHADFDDKPEKWLQVTFDVKRVEQ